MKLSNPKPVTICENPWSILDMVRHFRARDPRFNRSAEAARAGLRIEQALVVAGSGSADITESDLRLLAEVAEQPARGWGEHDVSVSVPDPSNPRDPARVVTRKAHAPTGDYLPLIDSIAEDAKSLPPLPTK